MLNQVTILGRVVEVCDDRDAVIVVVQTADREWKGKRYTDLAACRFYGSKPKEQAAKVTPGAMVKIDAKVTSRKSDRGGWFSTVEARYLEVLEAGRAAAPAPKDDAPPVDDSDVPF